MPADIVLGLTAFAIVVGWIWLVWRLSWFVAELIAMPFRRAGDEEIDRYVGSGNPDYGMSFVPITHGDRRVQLLWSLFVLPPVAWLHYRYWEPLGDAMAWVFEDVLAPFIVDTFYSALAVSVGPHPLA